MAALFLLGLAWIALLPPFEGMDEAGHYASIESIALHGQIAQPGRSTLPAAVTDYAAAHPMPVGPSGATAFRLGRTDYRTFFTTGPVVTTAAPAVPNWEAQHPPLYYLTMAPLLWATSGLDLRIQFLVLRSASWAMALAGLALGLRATLAMPGVDADDLRRTYRLIPLIAPVFVTEFARIGNDALCLLIMGWLWGRIAHWLRERRDVRAALAVGCVLALGLLTKALFLPVLLGITGWGWSATRDMAARDRREIGKAFILPVCFALLWYVARWRAFGALSGSLDEMWLAQNGGMLRALVAHFSWSALGHLIAITVTSWLFSGTASQIAPTAWLAMPVVALNLALFAACGWKMMRARDATRILPLWVLAALAAALGYFELVCLALNGGDRAPGWYLNAAMPATAMIYAQGWAVMATKPMARRASQGVLVWSALLIAYSWAMQVALVTGAPTEGTTISAAQVWGWLSGGHDVMGRLAVLSCPDMAVVCLAGAGLCLWRSVRLQHPL